MSLNEALDSKESEMMVLGCMLTNSKAFQMGVDVLAEVDFYHCDHQHIFSSLQSLYRAEKSADIHLTAETLKAANKLEKAGGVAYLTTLAQFAGTSAYIEEYLEGVKEFSNKRRLLNLFTESQKKIIRGDRLAHVLLDAQEGLKHIEKNRSAKDKFQIRFADQFSQNFLLVSPPKKPMLLDYVGGDGKSVHGYLPKSIVGMLVGAGGVGKTTLLSQLVISITTGSPFLGLFTPTHYCGEGCRGNVFLGLGENQYEDIHRILYKAGEIARQTYGDLQETSLLEASRKVAVFSFSGQQSAFIEKDKPTPYFRELKNRLEEIAPKDGWSLLIFDPISRIMGADAESDNASATQFIALMEELSLDLPGNPTVLLAHHVNKAALNKSDEQNQSAARGSSALTDGVRWQINLMQGSTENSKENGNLVLKMTKSNFTAYPPHQTLIKGSHGGLILRKDGAKSW